MDYSEQPLQFISYHYFQAKDENHGEYQNISTLIFTLTQIPLFGMPFISCVTFNYIHPKLFLLVGQFQVRFANHYSIPISEFSKLLYYTACKASFLFTLLLVISHVRSIVEFIDYGNEVLDDSDHSMPYVNAGFSGSAIIVMLVIVYAGCIYKARQLQCYKSNNMQPEYRSFVIATSLSINILYILCYFCPYMLLAFLNDPLVTFLTYFMIIFATVCWFLLWFISIFLFITGGNKLIANQSIEAKRLILVLLMLTFMIVAVFSIYAFGLVVLYFVVTFAVVLENFSSTHLLQVVLISFLIGLISVLLLKPVKKEVRDHAGLINSDNTSTEHGETHSNDIA